MYHFVSLVLSNLKVNNLVFLTSVISHYHVPGFKKLFNDLSLVNTIFLASTFYRFLDEELIE